MQAILVMFKGDGTRHEFPVKRRGTLIGRLNSCDLRIPLSSVSRQHCILKVDGSKLILRDTGSTNGTFHNSVRVTEAVLAAGDEVVIGPVVFTVMIDGEPNEIEPVYSLVEPPAGDEPPVELADDLLEEVMQEVGREGKTES